MAGMITIHEMENEVRGGGPDFSLANDIGNVIEISDTNDALGLNMLMNPGKTGGGGGGSSRGAEMSFAPPDQGSSGLAEIDITNLDTVEPMTLNLGPSSSIGMGGAAPVEIQFSKAKDEASGSGLFGNSQTATGPGLGFAPALRPRMDPELEKKEKIELINKLQRLEQKGFQLTKHYSMDNSLDEIKQEFTRLVDARNLEASLRFQRQALMSVVTGLEWANGKFDPFDLKLDGWSESVHENVEDFDEIFEELYDKYKDRGKMPPEARLIMALAGSGFMCHVSNTFLRSKAPSMDDILKNNPDLARQFATAAAQQAGPGFGNFMGMAMNGGGAAPGASFGANPAGAFFGSSAQQQQQSPLPPQVPQSVAAVEPPKQTARREMKGPSGVDDILRQFEAARTNEGMDGSPIMGPPLNQNSATQPAVAAAVEIQSMASEDIGSAAESTRTGTRGGRRRRAAVGNTIRLDV
jgi:hypothetical protein